VSGGDVGCVSLRITDEDGKLPLNALMPPVTSQAAGSVNAPTDPNWMQIFQAFFVSFKIDPEVVDALSDWLDADDTPRGSSGAERGYYERLPVPYKPPDGRMRTPEELRLVKGLDNPEELAKLFPGTTPEAVADLDLGSNSYLTVFGAEQPQQARVNLNTATPEVLTALIAGLQPDNSAAQTVVQDIVARRQEKQFRTLNEAVQGTNLRQALGRVADVKSTHFRVESVGVVGVVRKKIVAVLKRPQQQIGQALVTRPPITQPTVTQPPITQPTVTPSNMLYFKIE
jgi:general secretion pathway protein K